MPFNIPNSLTWARIALIPFFVGIYYLPADVISAEGKNLVATVTFVVAAVTDWFDGYLARSLGQTSAFGAFLDPVADKLMVAAALIVLVHLGRVDSLIALVIIGREITISALREWMAQMGAHGLVKVAGLGKLKTIVQMTAISCLLFQEDLWLLPVFKLGEWLLAIAAALTLWLGWDYLRAAWPTMRKKG